MPKRIDKLTDAQRARFGEWADRWIEIGLRTGEADWERFEAAAKECYRFAGIPWPGVVIRVPSPLIGAFAAPIASYLLQNAAPSTAPRGAVGGVVRGAVRGAVDGVVRGDVHRGWHQFLGGQFWVGGWGWGGCWTSYFREVAKLELPGDMWDRARAYETTMESASWWWPNRAFVMVCQRPREIHLEQVAPRGWGSHRLHSADGPAIAWEGWPLYFIHGVRVDEKVVERPETLTPGEILGQPNAEVRRVMIERFGVDRLMLEANAQLLDADGDPDGPSSRQLLMLRLDGDEPIVMVKVVNSTPEADGSWKSYMLRVPPRTRTCAEAVGWTFAMEAGEYRPAVET